MAFYMIQWFMASVYFRKRECAKVDIFFCLNFSKKLGFQFLRARVDNRCCILTLVGCPVSRMLIFQVDYTV